MSDEEPKLIPIDEEANDQIMHRRRFGKADRATHETCDPGPEVDVLACDLLCVLFADHVLLRGDMSLIGTPPIRVKTRDATGRQQALEFEQDGILPPSKDRRSHGATVVIDRMPQPPRLRFLPHITPHLIAL
jgi:hypothetical protein